MSLINNLIALPCHASAMPISATSGAVNLAAKIGVDDLESTSNPGGSEKPPLHANGLTYSVTQIALDPLPTQNNRQEPKDGNDARNNRNVAPDCDVFGCHAK
jgi:hypothetical protein